MPRKVIAAILAHSEAKPLLSDAHVPVDGTLIKAWASMKRFQPKADTAPPNQVDGPDDPPSPPSDTAAPDPGHTEIKPMPRKTSRNRHAKADCRRQKRSHSTHASVSDPEARLYKKSPGAGASPCVMAEMRLQKHRFRSLERVQPQSDGKP